MCSLAFQMKVLTSAGSSQLALLSLTLLLPVPRSVTPHPGPEPEPEPPSVGILRLPSPSFRLSTSLELASSSSSFSSEVWGAWPGEEAELQRRARENANQDGGGGPPGEALTSILGGLQSVSREKGGFGFRFGRNSRTRGRGP
uniref:Pyroglutamylated RFamide peptide n=1 Tax=Hippocampus comes TaxID=109280 RepID=A0A3Q2YV12_HIPCM